MNDKFEYELHVHTGFASNSGTKSNVFCRIFGTDGDTGIRKLDDEQREVVCKNSLYSFPFFDQKT